MLVIIGICMSIISSKYMLPLLIKFAERTGMNALNYKDNKLYNSIGIFFGFNILILCLIYLLYEALSNKKNNYFNSEIAIIIIGVISASLAGYIDDNSNDPSKGIKRHIGMLLKGELSAGAIKACTGILVSLIICLISGFESYNFIINFLTILMMQNFINLMDLRPGRAIKAYMAVSFAIFPFMGINTIYFFINCGVMVSLLFYLPYELDEVCMMGDTGSNGLGILLGIIISSIGRMTPRIILLATLVIVQIYAETRSISNLIESNKIMRFIDMTGRKPNGNYKDKKRNSKRNSQPE